MAVSTEWPPPPATPPRRSTPPPSHPRRPGPGLSKNGLALIRLVVIVAAVIAVFLAFNLGATLFVIVSIFAIVGLHEFAHFITAKWSGMKVTEFFIGFGPRLWSVRKGETEYGFKPILAGAYVKIPGMSMLDEVAPEDEARTYRQQPFRKRVLVASAGSIMHLMIAFVLAYCSVLAFGIGHSAGADVAGFVKWTGHQQTAAQEAGLKKGDHILTVNGHRVNTGTQLHTLIAKSKGGPLLFVVTRKGVHRTFTVTPARGTITGTREVIGPGSTYFIGINITPLAYYTSEGPLRALGTAAAYVGTVGTAEVTGLGHFLSPNGLHKYYNDVTNPASKAAGSPTSGRPESIVGVARTAVQAEHKGIFYVFQILIALNLVLGLINMLPLLPFDGGHVAVALYERIRTRRGQPYYRADIKKMLPVTYVVFAALLVIGLSALFLDLAHPVSGG